MINQFQLFKTRRFLPLFITQFFGAFNDNAFKNALLIWFTYVVAERSGLSASMMVTLAAGIFILPFFLFSATAGQLADKYEKTFLIKIIKTIEIILMLCAAMGFYFGWVNLLLVIVFLMGTHSTFFGPIKYSLLPEQLKKNELIAGNGFVESGTFLAILLGTIFAGLVILTVHGIFWLSLAVVIFAIIGCVSGCFVPKSVIPDPRLQIRKNIWFATLDIVRDAKQKESVWLSIIGISWLWFVGAMFLMQFPLYSKQIIMGNAHVVTFFLTLFSLGIGAGSICCNKLLKGNVSARLVPWGIAGMSLSIFIFVLASYFYWQNDTVTLLAQDRLIDVYEFLSRGLHSIVITLSLFMLAVFSGIYVVPLYAIVQRESDQKSVSRIIAGNNVMNALFMVGSSLMSMAFFALHFSVIDILLVVGILNSLIYLRIRKIIKIVH